MYKNGGDYFSPQKYIILLTASLAKVETQFFGQEKRTHRFYNTHLKHDDGNQTDDCTLQKGNVPQQHTSLF